MAGANASRANHPGRATPAVFSRQIPEKAAAWPTPETRADRIQARIDRSQDAAATFARVGEEFKAMRKATPAGPARDRLDKLIELNSQTAAVVRRTLAINERDFGREKAE
jgi:hypothetical protein